MPLNGSGTFNRLYTWVNDRINGVKITDSRMDAEFNGIATALSSALYKDGQQTNAANQNWGGFRLTNLGDATAATDALNRQTGDARYFQRAEAEQTVASASTIDISAAGRRWSVTGTTGITTITAGNNANKQLRFSDTLTLTHDGTSLILPGATDLTVGAGDIINLVTDGSGNVRVTSVLDASDDPEGILTTADVLDEDDFASDSATLPPSQQSAKAYIASQVLDEDDFATDSAIKAPSQQSVGAYVKDNAAGLAALTMTNMIGNSRQRISLERGDGPVNLTNTVADITDRWKVAQESTTAVVSCGRSSVSPDGFDQSFIMDVTTADASLGSGEYCFVEHRLPQADIIDLRYGNSDAQPSVVGVWVRATKTCTLSLFIRNYNGSTHDQSYIANFDITAADTWEYKTFVVPARSLGTWGTYAGEWGASIGIGLGSEATLQGSQGWNADNNIASSTQDNFLSTTGTFYFTGMSWHVGETPVTETQSKYMIKPMHLDEYDCRRFLRQIKVTDAVGIPGRSSSTTQAVYYINMEDNPMIDAPTLQYTASELANSHVGVSRATISGISINAIDGRSVSLNATHAAQGGVVANEGALLTTSSGSTERTFYLDARL
jgi:hypothetical protein